MGIRLLENVSSGDNAARGRSPVPVTPITATLTLVALTVLALAFILGRMTAPSHTTAPPSLVPAHSGAAALSLPQLSEATALPPLAVATAVGHSTPPHTAAKAKPKPKSRPGAPVVIVGSG